MGIKERKEREKELRRDEILNTGEKLFIKKGIEQTTMDEIARECELAKGTLYLHFKSKEDLLSAIMYRALTRLYDLMYSYQEGIASPIERLKKIGDAHFEFYSKYPDHFRLLYAIHTPGRFHPHSTDDMNSQLHKRVRSIWELNMKVISDGIKMGVFRESADPLEVAISLWAVSTAMIQMHDFTRSMPATADHDLSGMPFADFDFLNTITINAKRIIFTILKNPPEYFEELLKLT